MPITPEDCDLYAELDELAAQCGGYVDPNANCPDYDIRAIDAYCKERNIKPNTLSDEELKQFIRPAKSKKTAA